MSYCLKWVMTNYHYSIP